MRILKPRKHLRLYSHWRWSDLNREIAFAAANELSLKIIGRTSVSGALWALVPILKVHVPLGIPFPFSPWRASTRLTSVAINEATIHRAVAYQHRIGWLRRHIRRSRSTIAFCSRNASFVIRGDIVFLKFNRLDTIFRFISHLLVKSSYSLADWLKHDQLMLYFPNPFIASSGTSICLHYFIRVFNLAKRNENFFERFIELSCKWLSGFASRDAS